MNDLFDGARGCEAEVLDEDLVQLNQCHRQTGNQRRNPDDPKYLIGALHDARNPSHRSHLAELKQLVLQWIDFYDSLSYVRPLSACGYV